MTTDTLEPQTIQVEGFQIDVADAPRTRAAGKPWYRGRINWDVLIGLVVIHAMACLAPFTFSWSAFGVFLVLQWLTGGIGVTLGYHRLLTHRSFKTPKWLEYTATFVGSLALQGGPIKWVATHRIHHAYSDRAQDPHSPKRGFWWAHMCWLFAYDEILNHENRYWRYTTDLTKDRVHLFINRTHAWHNVLLGMALFALGGWSWVIWGVFVRLVYVYHVTWLVNSASHIWGYQTYDTGEGSRNNWWVALLSYGEGWHNNHHAYPYSAAHGLKWWEFDLTYVTIKALSYIGLITDIRLPRGNPAKLMFSPEVPRAERLATAFPNVTAFQDKPASS